MSLPSATSPSGTAAPAGRSWHVRQAIAGPVLALLPAFALVRVRMLTLKACGIRAGRATLFWGSPKLVGRGAVASRLKIGDFCGFNDGCEFDLRAPITIGNHVSVGHEVRFLTSQSADGVETAAPITVGDGAWLGARSKLLAGVNVGAGSVIGAGITVAADVPPNMLMTGGKPISLAKWR
ncbi:MAG: acyltransferase [Pseudomonadota bacterium]